MKRLDHNWLQQTTARAVRKVQRIEAKLSRRTGPARPGDIFLFDIPRDVGVEWAVVLPHADDPGLLFSVPVDANPMAGSADISLPDTAACAPLVLRCGCGMWVPQEEFDLRLRSGLLEDKYVEAARKTLHHLATGDLASIPARHEVDDDPEYIDWLTDIDAAREAILASFGAKDFVIRIEDFRPHQSNTAVALAAAAGGLAGEVAKILHRLPMYHRVQIDHPGDFYLLAEPQGIRALWIATSGTPPSVRSIDAGGRKRTARWVAKQDRSAYRTASVLPWRDDQVVLLVGKTKPRKLVVRR